MSDNDNLNKDPLADIDALNRQAEGEVHTGKDEPEVRSKKEPKKGSMGVLKMTLIGLAVAGALFGAASVVLLSGHDEYDDPLAGIESTAPVHPQAQQLSPPTERAQQSADFNNDFGDLSQALSEGGPQAQQPADAPKQPIDTSEYVTQDKYSALKMRFDELALKVAELERANLAISSSSGRSAPNSNLEARVKIIEGRLSSVEKFIADNKDSLASIDELIAKQKKEIFERDGNVRTDVPLSAKGRSRLIGYQYAMGTENKDVAIVINASNSMTVLTNGVFIDYAGKKVPVVKVIDADHVVLLGEEYFIDKTKGIGPALSVTKNVNVAKTSNASSATSDKPRAIKNITNWKMLATTPDPAGGYEATVETPSGQLITLKRGEMVRTYGRVIRVDQTGVYFAGYRIKN